MKFLQPFKLFESKKDEKYIGKDRIVLIGPPTIGKSTIAEGITNQLGLKWIELDKMQEEIGYGEEKEQELVNSVLSKKFDDYDKPSVLGFGGGHPYLKGVKNKLKDYPNVILLLPSENKKKSDELLCKSNNQRWISFMDEMIKGFKSGKHDYTKEEEKKYIDKLEKMKKGAGGQIKKEELPKTKEMEGWGGIELVDGWDKIAPLSEEEEKKCRELAKHIVYTYYSKGNRRNKKDIVKDIIKLLK